MTQYIVEIVCKVRKQVTCADCTREQAKKDPWEYAIHEVEMEQIDWDVMSVMEDKA